MDVFYYWKDFVDDRKNGRIGRFRSAKERLNELQEGSPDYVWAFKTPPGKKGQVQLLARLVWSPKPLVEFTTRSDETHLFYNPSHEKSVWYEGTDSDTALDQVTTWVRTHLHTSLSSNFQGTNGQKALRGSELFELNAIARRFETRPFAPSPSEA